MSVKPHLVLFFTRRMSLAKWHESGMLNREIALYRELVNRGVKVSFVTYGGHDDQEFAKTLPGIEVCSNTFRLPRRWYERAIPFVHRRVLANCDVIKTNQTQGGEIAARSARLFDKPLIARCGFMWSKFEALHHGENSPQARDADQEERKLFSSAYKVVVTTPEMEESVNCRVSTRSPVSVIPNFVDINQFINAHRTGVREFDLVFVGRLVPQKNVESLLAAIQPLNVRLLMIGGGGDVPIWKQRYAHLSDRVTWIGNVEHAQLATHLQRAKAYILPSHFEGHPKTLIEAMACGLPVVATNVDGIRGVVEHDRTGCLANTDPSSLRVAIECVLSDSEMRQRLGEAARIEAVERFSLDRIVEMELNVIQEACGVRETQTQAA